MTATTISNGRARKSLEQQIDRLDAILDGLAEALHGAVADAVKEAVGVAVQEAVRAVLKEVLTNPDLARAAAPKAEEQPRRRSLVRRAWTWMVGKVSAAGRLVRRAVRSAWSATAARLAPAVGAAVVATRLVRTSPRTAGVAGGVGLAVGVGCYLCGPVVASVVGGVCGAIGALAYPVVMPLWRMLRMTEVTG